MLKKIGIIAALCVFIAGCSSLKFAYGFAETVIRDRAETYLDISEQEGPALESEISSLVSWHRIEMLPEYAAFFESQAQLAEGAGWTRSQVEDSVRTFRALIKETSAGAAPYIARVLVNHTNEDKIGYIKYAMADVLSERRERYDEPLEDQIDASVEKSVSSFERFFGSLSNQQLAIVREHKTETYDPSGEWLNWREKRQDDLVRFLSAQPDVDEIQDYVTVALTAPEQIFGEAYRTQADRWWDEQTDRLYELLTTLDAEQRQTFANNLRGYAIDMVELADAS